MVLVGDGQAIEMWLDHEDSTLIRALIYLQINELLSESGNAIKANFSWIVFIILSCDSLCHVMI